MICEVDCFVNKKKENATEKTDSIQKVNWKKADIDLYKAKVEERISLMLCEGGVSSCTDLRNTTDAVNKLNIILNEAANISTKC